MTESIMPRARNRLKDEVLTSMGTKMLPSRPLFLEPTYSKVDEDYDAIYAYNPNAILNFLRSRGFAILDLWPIPARIFRLPTPDVEVIRARKTGNKAGRVNRK